MQSHCKRRREVRGRAQQSAPNHKRQGGPDGGRGRVERRGCMSLPVCCQQRPRLCPRCYCRCHARLCRAACPEGQCPPAGGRNRSRVAMCRAQGHAVPQTHTISISSVHYGGCKGPCKMTIPRLASMNRGSASSKQRQCRQCKLAICTTESFSIIGRDITNATNISHATTWPQLPHAASQRRRNKPR